MGLFKLAGAETGMSEVDEVAIDLDLCQ